MKTVFLKVNETKPDIRKKTLSLVKWLQKAGVTVLLDASSAKLLGRKTSKIQRSAIDLYIAFGGDGTLLSLVRQAGPTDVPFVGINAGRLGFLADIKLEKMRQALAKIIKGRYDIDNRMALESEVEVYGGKIKKLRSLNDIVVSGIRGRLITLDVHVNEEYLNTYRADGIIISTPTGSTAYSLSAGGPIVNPKLSGIIITPVCPHTMSNRPIILPPDSILKVFVSGKGQKEVKIIADGQVECLMGNRNMLVVQKAIKPVKLISPGRNSFYGILREKLNWR